MTAPDIRRVLSANVRARMRGRTQVELSVHMGKTEAWASNFLLDKNAVPVVRLPLLAEFCGCSVADLFTIDVHESSGVPSPVTGAVVDSAHGAAQTHLLEHRLTAAQKENAALRHAVDSAYEILAVARKPQGAAARSRRHR